MTKPREKTREELTAEIEDGKKKIWQLENREKMLRQKLSKEERRTRSHRLIVRGAVFESIVPEAKTMTDEEAAALLRLALTSQPAQEFLRKRAEGRNTEYPPWTQGRTYTPLRACALCRGLISAQETFPALRYGGFAATGDATLPLRQLALSTLLCTCRKRTPCYASYSLSTSLNILSGR